MTRSQLLLSVLILVAVATQAAVLRSTRYVGGSVYATATVRIAVDQSGFIYEAGSTNWPDFPTTTGPFSRSLGGRDVFIRKISPDNQKVIYSVLIGGSDDETCSGVAVDAQGNVYVAGMTASADFPVTVSSQVTPKPSNRFAFVLKLDVTGTKLGMSRLIGGAGFTSASSIALAPDGRVVIVGNADAGIIPTTPNAVQRVAATSPSAFVARFAEGTIDYATYLGGPGGSTGTDIAVDRFGDIYVAGFAGAFFPTLSTSFAAQAPFGGFVSKIDHASGQFAYSTYVPGAFRPGLGPGGRISIRVDAKGHAYVAGPATLGFPASSGAFQTQPKSNPYERYPGADAFVLELNEDGSSLVFATLFGGAGNDHPMALALTGGTVTIAGVTSTPDLPMRDYGLPTCNLLSVPDGSPYTTFVASFDHSGKLVTSFGFGACHEDLPSALEQGPSELFMAGYYGSGAFVSFLLGIDLNATAPVQISAVADAASLQMGPYVPLEIVSIFGKGLGPAQGVAASPTGGVFPAVLAGTRVFVSGRPAPLLYVGADQINAIIPRATQTRTEVGIDVVTASFEVSSQYTTWMRDSTPALFTVDGSGVGQGAILNQDYTVNSAANPAARGSAIMLFGTGGGLTSPSFGDGQVVPSAASVLIAEYMVVLFGNKYAKAFYAGTAPGQVNGLMQVNVVIPEDAPTGPAVPVWTYLAPYRSRSGVTVAIR
jgi:uncharacterized protein (TIGR03437 family)